MYLIKDVNLLFYKSQDKDYCNLLTNLVFLTFNFISNWSSNLYAEAYKI
ncbi:hypothetical protein VAEKB19_40002 [Vibrio aestuarianus]|nr:hypothetical protein VAEKB19_40002 [Vibrio aestuarianus]